MDIDMGGTTTVPADFLDEIAGKDVEITFDMGNGLTWTVNGKDIPTGGGLATLNLGVYTGGTDLSAMVENIDGSTSYVQLNLKHDGAFPFKLTLSVTLDKMNAGYFANLYYNNEAAGALELITAAKVGIAGTTELVFYRASTYAIIVSAENHTWVNPFTDVDEGAWFYTDVAYVHQHGLFGGTSATTFSPGVPMTRGMAVTVLGRLAEIDTEKYGGASFDDVDTAQYYAPYVKWAAELGIVSGVGNNKFAPDANISRQDLAVILNNYADKLGITIKQTLQDVVFADSGDIADYAAAAVENMVRAGVITGRPGNVFDPKAEAGRAEVAAMLHRFANAEK